jgi:predicted DsbA family dithiol-disulfide isomerase
MTLTIDIWSDIACPWCLIGKRRFDKALATFPFRDQVRVTYHSFVLDPDLPDRFDGTEVEYLAQRKGIALPQVRQMLDNVTGQAASEGLAYDWDHLVVSSSLTAHRLLHAARRLDDADRTRGVQARFKDALLVARFEQGRDIADSTELVTIATASGFTEDEARAALADPSLADAVAGDLAAARDYGIGGVPFYVLGERYGLSGAQPTEVFADALDEAWHALNP